MVYDNNGDNNNNNDDNDNNNKNDDNNNDNKNDSDESLMMIVMIIIIMMIITQSKWNIPELLLSLTFAFCPFATFLSFESTCDFTILFFINNENI